MPGRRQEVNISRSGRAPKHSTLRALSRAHPHFPYSPWERKKSPGSFLWVRGHASGRQVWAALKTAEVWNKHGHHSVINDFLSLKMEASVLTEYYGRSIRADLGVNSLVLLWDSMAKKKKRQNRKSNPQSFRRQLWAWRGICSLNKS